MEYLDLLIIGTNAVRWLLGLTPTRETVDQWVFDAWIWRTREKKNKTLYACKIIVFYIQKKIHNKITTKKSFKSFSNGRDV